MEINDNKIQKIDFEAMFPHVEDSSTLMVRCRPADYSASVICRAVEDCDAHVLNLNVEGPRDERGMLMVWLRVSHRRSASVVRSLERFGYEVEPLSEAGEEPVDNARARDRANELLRYLEV